MNTALIRERLDNIRREAEALKTKKAQAEAVEEQLEKQEQELITELAGLGATPQTAESVVNDLEGQIAQALDEAENLLKGVPES